jgi:hypothetical protein
MIDLAGQAYPETEMRSTDAADRLELALEEIRDAIHDIEILPPPVEAPSDALNAVLRDALKKALQILQSAQQIAEQEGVPRLRLEAL